MGEKKEGGEHINLKVVTQDGNEIYFKRAKTHQVASSAMGGGRLLKEGNLRARMLNEQLHRPCGRNQHLFRSPLECAGVQGYTLAEVEQPTTPRPTTLLSCFSS